MEEWKKVANQLDKDHAKGTPPSETRPGNAMGCAWGPACLTGVPRAGSVPAPPAGLSVSEGKE